MVKVYKKVVTSFKMQVKRRYLMLLKKEVVENGLKRRRGECLSCGACCKSSFPCPFLFEQDGRLLCKIHDNKPDVCKTYPFNEDDIFPHTRESCGYYFVDEDNRLEEKTANS